MSTSQVPQVYTPPSMAVSTTNETAANMLAARAAKEVEARALVAMRHPRNEDGFRQNILKSCERFTFAEGAMYSKPVGGKDIVGLSIRFAEECVRYYGNLDVATILISEDDDRRVFETAATDIQTNNVFRVPVIVTKTVERKFPKKTDEVIRTRINSYGDNVSIIRADDDALLTKQAALIAKAQREVILKHIPSDVKEEAEEKIVATVKAKVDTDPDGQKKKILDGFFNVGVTAEQVATLIGHPLAALNPAELHWLRRVFMGIRDGEATWADVMAAKQMDDAAAAPAAATADAPAATTATKPGSMADRLRRAAPAPVAPAAVTETAPAPAAPATTEQAAETKPAAEGPHEETDEEIRAFELKQQELEEAQRAANETSRRKGTAKP